MKVTVTDWWFEELINPYKKIQKEIPWEGKRVKVNTFKVSALYMLQDSEK